MNTVKNFLIPHDCGSVFYNCSLKDKNTWKVGGAVSAYIVCDTIQELQKSIQFLETNHINWIIIGQGSNLLIADGFIHGVVIKLGKSFTKAKVFQNKIVVGSAMFVPYLAHLTAGLGFKGLEHTIGIPGSVGGLIVMNGGSLHKSISQNIKSVKILNQQNEVQFLNNSQCKFDYRNSIFKNMDCVILEAEIEIVEFGTTIDIRDEMITILKTRRKKFPKDPSCGSVFKSDNMIFEKFGGPGKIVELLGFKGFQVGGAQVSSKHANFIINTKEATAKDIITLINIIKDRAAIELGISLQSEVLHLNNDCKLQRI